MALGECSIQGAVQSLVMQGEEGGPTRRLAETKAPAMKLRKTWCENSPLYGN